MKKLIRYWPILVAMPVIAPPVYVLSSIPQGGGWAHVWHFNPGTFSFQGSRDCFVLEGPDEYEEILVKTFGPFEVRSYRSVVFSAVDGRFIPRFPE